jgi:Protein of unknown function DUF58
VPASELTFPLVTRRRLVGLAFGSLQSSRRRTGSDVAGSRPYHPGDDMRTIDWNASAKLSAARSSDEFLVREHYAEEAPRVIIVCDRRPEMELFPDDLPWLSKPAVMREAGRLIVDSAQRARGLLGYLDYAEGGAEPFWRPPHSQQDFWRTKESRLPHPGFRASPDNLGHAMHHLIDSRRALPPGTFVFLLSDFLEPLDEEAWAAALELPWDLVPVVIQDPIWEQSFPPVGSVVVPVLEPATAKLRLLRLSKREARERRRRNEARIADLLARFTAFGLEPIVLSTADPDEIFRAFLSWAEQRMYGVGVRLN